MVAGVGSAVANVNGYYRTITLDQPASDLTNFAVLFSGTYTYLKTIANGGKVNNSNGYDIVFYSDSALTTKLDFERVYWSATTGDVEFWVRIPTLTSASATVIYLAYGKTSITTDQQSATATWNSNYKGVWHLPDGTTLTANDSTSTGANGTLVNTPTAIAGKIDGGANFASASSESINMGNVIDFTTNDFTIEFWFRTTDAANSYVIAKAAANSGQYIAYFTGIARFALFVQTDDSNWKQKFSSTTATTINDGNWHHVVCTREGTSNPTINLYIDGSNDSGTVQSAGTVGSVSNTGDLQFSSPFASPGSLFDGDLDEVRILNAIPGNIIAWVATLYSNQNDPANFYAIGSETPA